VEQAGELLEQAVAVGPTNNDRDGSLIRAMDLIVSLARGVGDACPCDRSTLLHDPVVATAVQLEAEALVLAGRFDDALDRLEGLSEQLHTSVGVGMAVVVPLALVLAGRAGPDVPMVLERVRETCEATGATASALVATALLAEVTGDVSALPDEVGDLPSVSAALVLRAKAVVDGDAEARAKLEALTAELVAPGLLAGL
jgi:hypothetical protein